MRNRRALVVMLAGTVLLPAHEARAQPALTAQDRADIQDLTVRYAKALGGCAAADYAELFAPETGYFASNIRGEVVGRERLMALVQSERHCIGPAPADSPGGRGAAAPRPAPMVAIESIARGVTGRADLGAAGHYDDEYVKTAEGLAVQVSNGDHRAGKGRESHRAGRRGDSASRRDGSRAVRRRVRGGARWSEAFPDFRCRAWSLRGRSDGTGTAEERRRSLRGRVRQDTARRLALQVARVCRRRSGSRESAASAALTDQPDPAPGCTKRCQARDRIGSDGSCGGCRCRESHV